MVMVLTCIYYIRSGSCSPRDASRLSRHNFYPITIFLKQNSFPQFRNSELLLVLMPFSVFLGGLVEVQIEMGIHGKFDGMIFLSNKMPNFRGGFNNSLEKDVKLKCLRVVETSCFFQNMNPSVVFHNSFRHSIPILFFSTFVPSFFHRNITIERLCLTSRCFGTAVPLVPPQGQRLRQCLGR